MALSSTIKGIEKIVAQLEKAKQRTLKRSLSKALRKAARPILVSARSEVPRRRGHLKKSLGIKTWAKVVANRAGAAVGARAKYRAGVNVPAKYLHLVHAGTKTAKANPFLRRAGNQTRTTARAILEDQFPGVLKSEIAKV